MLMELMNRVFKPYLGMLVIIFVCDILIYLSNKEKNHVTHLRIVLHTLKDRELYVKFSKCEFLLETIEFLGHMVSGDRIRVDTKKIKDVQICPRHMSSTDIRCFLGLVTTI